MGIKTDVLGSRLMGSFINAIKSTPDAPLVLYSGNCTAGSSFF